MTTTQNWFIWALLFASPLLLVSCSQKDEFTKRFGGNDAVKNISSAKKILGWRTDGGIEIVDGSYTRTGMPVVVSSELANHLKKVLLNPKSYRISRFTQKLCTPQPGIVVSFISQNDTNDVYFCFECAELIVQPNGKPLLHPIDFDPTFGEFVRIMKSLFPTDEKIQTLKESL